MPCFLNLTIRVGGLGYVSILSAENARTKTNVYLFVNTISETQWTNFYTWKMSEMVNAANR